MRIKIFILMVAAVLLFFTDIMAGDFTDNGDGTVTDSNTGIMWQQAEGGSMNWEDAITYCEDISLAGYNDWRLPNIKELMSIMDESLYNNIDTNYFPDAHASNYWSSTTCASDSSCAWSIHFQSGQVNFYYNKSENFYARCVRGGGMFKLIPAGTFTMGSPTDEPDRESDETQHEVTLSKGFYIQITEVTQGQWKAVMGSNPSQKSDCGDDCPVESVSWDDVQGFIEKLNQTEGTDKYRLPTEAEWEYACRAGTTTAFANGDVTETVWCGYDPNLDQMGWYCGNSDNKTHPVAQKEPNDWGLYDMHGNVKEWCQDWKGDYPSSPVTDPTGPSSGTYRVFRGGSWGNVAGHCRSAIRGWHDPDYRDHGLGFRVARDF